jgi:hypothetical protein
MRLTSPLLRGENDTRLDCFLSWSLEALSPSSPELPPLSTRSRPMKKNVLLDLRRGSTTLPDVLKPPPPPPPPDDPLDDVPELPPLGMLLPEEAMAERLLLDKLSFFPGSAIFFAGSAAFLLESFTSACEGGATRV